MRFETRTAFGFHSLDHAFSKSDMTDVCRYTFGFSLLFFPIKSLKPSEYLNPFLEMWIIHSFERCVVHCMYSVWPKLMLFFVHTALHMWMCWEKKAENVLSLIFWRYQELMVVSRPLFWTDAEATYILKVESNP